MADNHHFGNHRRKSTEGVSDRGVREHRFNWQDMPLRKVRRQVFDLKAKALDGRRETAVSQTRPDLMEGEIDHRWPGG